MEVQEMDQADGNGAAPEHGNRRPAPSAAHTPHDTPPEDAVAAGEPVTRPRLWRRRSRRWTTMGILIAAATIAAGAAWWPHGGSSPTESTLTVNDVESNVSVYEADLLDPSRLRAALTRSGVPFLVRTVPIKVIKGTRFIGCAGPGQDGLPQIYAVLGKPPLIHPIGDAKGITIKLSAMPAGAVLSFIFWVLPGSAHPVAPPDVSLQQGTPPPCTPPTDLPAATK